MTTASERLGGARGFTLVELMLAVAILGMVLVMLAGSFHAVASGKVQAENRLAVDQTARAILAQIADEIRGAVQTPMVSSRVLLIGYGHMQDGVPLDSISVSTLDPSHRRALEGFGAEDTITYTTSPNPHHPGWQLLLRSQSSSLLISGAAGNANAAVVIAANVLSLHFRYFDGSNWGESWNSQSLPPGASLPAEVSIELVMASAGGAPLRLSTMVMLPMAFQQW
jgi:prepilin-type N-terminal cleavage/methylation domain-containing protein